MTKTVTSADGTTIAYDLLGSGPPAVVIGGATCDRARTADTAAALADDFTVVNYDRRGRGDSGDTLPYSVSREIEDLAAVLGEFGGPAFVYGHSSGAALLLHALVAGLPIKRAVLHEPPYGPESAAGSARSYRASLLELLEAGRRDDALALFFTITGVPASLVAEWRTEPWWARTAALAPTLAYDSAVMDDEMGGIAPLAAARTVGAPTLVLVGGASPEWMQTTDAALAQALPAGELQLLEGEHHVVAPKTLAPVLSDYFRKED